jgi:hypothetical protein
MAVPRIMAAEHETSVIDEPKYQENAHHKKGRQDDLSCGPCWYFHR